MKHTAEILCVGTELLLGDILNTNAKFLSNELAAIGIDVYNQSVVGDNHDRLKAAIELALSRVDILITSGGLGPTLDDITKETVCEVLGSNLVYDESVKENIISFFKRRGRPMTENNLKQALVPEDGEVLYNENGTAPGLLVRKNGKLVFMLPGPPREIEPLFVKMVLPILKNINPDRVLVSKNINIFGMGESSVEALLKPLMESSDNPTVAPYAKDGEVLLRVTASAATESQASALIDGKIDEIRKFVGEYIYGIDENSLQRAVVERFTKRGLTLSTAESCTGGYVSKRITEIPGASAMFGCGVCSYSNEIKEKVLGVRHETLEKYGAVSPQTADEMASGVMKLSGSDVSVSVTGIAGPDGGTDEKPVGLVYICAKFKDKTMSETLNLGRTKNERQFVQYLAASSAIALALKITGEFNA